MFYNLDFVRLLKVFFRFVHVEIVKSNLAFVRRLRLYSKEYHGKLKFSVIFLTIPTCDAYTKFHCHRISLYESHGVNLKIRKKKKNLLCIEIMAS